MSRWLCVVALLGGCAFSLDGPDPNRPSHTLPRCDTSKGLVALDGVVATGLAVTALSLSSESEPAVALLPLALGTLYLAGAVSGNRAVNKCREALDTYERDYRGETFAAQGGPPLDDDDDEEPETTTRKKKGKKKMIPRTQSAYAGQEPGQPPAPQPQQPYTPQGYPPQQPPAQMPPQPQAPQQPPQAVQQRPAPVRPAPRPEPEESDWSDFWREVP